ncbi:MAG: hypothetical protein QOI11_1263 [Candidatus Eremiobacteraeota bacterium]|jgi:hypothetical protein|nr:hypothetical protein [Candidatus Eremiobacteraeota bacterium]
MSMRSVLLGTVAGAVGTAALDLATYTDMIVRARPASETPSEFVKKLAQDAGIAYLSGDDDDAKNRRSGTGALLGYANGLGVGALYGALRPLLRGVPLPLAALAAGGAAMALSDVPLVRSGVTDPQSWGTSGWLADALPHALYGLAVALTFDALAAQGGD